LQGAPGLVPFETWAVFVPDQRGPPTNALDAAHSTDVTLAALAANNS